MISIIEALLTEKMGLDLNSLGSQTIVRAINKRRLACQMDNLTDYTSKFKNSLSEQQALIEEIVVRETWFFRDKVPFDYLQQCLSAHQGSSRAHTPIRVLSVPCSIGAEPYSIAIALVEAGFSPESFQIDAVDISQVAIEKAQQASYGKNAFRTQPLPSAHSPYFDSIGEERWQVKDFIRKTVQFKQHNLLQGGLCYPQQYQVIFCRNLLIYLHTQARDRILDILEEALVPEGLLFVGSAETAIVNNLQPVKVPFTFAFRKSQTVCQNLLKTEIKAKTKTVKQKPPLSQPTILQPQLKLASAQGVPCAVNQAPDSLLAQARKLANLGQLESALKLCEDYLQSDRTSASAYVLLGEIYQSWDRCEQATVYFERALYLNPNQLDAIVHLALIKEHQGDVRSAAILRQRWQRRQQQQV